MTKSEYKVISRNIRKCARTESRYLTERTGIKHTTRSVLHGVQWWCDNLYSDKYGNSLADYKCVGDYDLGLCWQITTHGHAKQVLKLFFEKR